MRKIVAHERATNVCDSLPYTFVCPKDLLMGAIYSRSRSCHGCDR